MREPVAVVTAPQLGVNDDVAVLIEWHVESEARVHAGDRLCTLETSKAVFDVEATAAGHVLPLVDAGAEVAVSAPIALIGDDLDALHAERSRLAEARPAGSRPHEDSGARQAPAIRRMASSGPRGSATGPDDLRATDKAKRLAAALGVDLREVAARGIIREQDVRRHHEQRARSATPSADALSWDETRPPVVIYGAGRGGLTVLECLRLTGTHAVVCLLDDAPPIGRRELELPVFPGSALETLVARGVRALACAIADARVRLRIRQRCEMLGVELINVIHPAARIAPSVRMGVGNYVKAGAVIETNTRIGDCCIIDNGAVIPHDNVIGDGCHLAPGASLGSSITVGDRSIIGIGASVATGVTIGRDVIVSVGSAVTRDVPDHTVVEGVPARTVGARSRRAD